MALVLVERPQPHTTVVTMHRPDRLNAMSIELVSDLYDALEDVAADNDCWVAVAMGLVSRVVPDADLLATALDMAERMCEYSPYGLAMTKDVLWVNLETTSLESAIQIEDRNQLMLGFTENLPEAIRAFDAGRK